MLNLKYKSGRGEVRLSGDSSAIFRITETDGFGVAERSYNTATYTGSDGQSTISSKYLPRTITLSGDIVSDDIRTEFSRAVDIMSEPGYLYVSDGGADRRIYCNQMNFPDINRILRGKIASFAVQFVCDSPYFEDAADTEIPIYRRIKNLSTPFTLPAVFGTTAAENTAFNIGSAAVEPVIAIRFTKTLSSAETVKVTNSTTGASVSFLYTPHSGDVVKIDIPGRRLTSSRLGTITEQLSDDTYLSDFRLERGRNVIGVSVGDAQSGAVVACIFNNKYLESAVI